MLRTLYIRDYALIEELDVSFGPGLNILTGETGAGKSILIGALKLLLGDRASPDRIRKGASKAILEATLDVLPDDERVRRYLAEQGIEAESTLCLRREISPNQSRAFVNDTPVTLPVLRELGSYLVDLHGQHEHQSLLRVEQHGYLLDSVSGLGPQLEAYQERYRRYQALLRQRQALEERAKQMRERRELYAFQAQEIDAVAPSVEEEAALEAERRRLENAERLYASTAQLRALLSESEGAVLGQLATSAEELEELARIDAAFAPWSRELRSALVTLEELARFLLDYQGRIAFDPERLEAIRGRLGAFERLKRRYGGALEAVLLYRERIGRELEAADQYEAERARLEEALGEWGKSLSEAAWALSEARHRAAGAIESAVVAELVQLGIPHARFAVRLERESDPEGWVQGPDGRRYAAGPRGIDRVEFLISTNPGEDLKELARTASGGEISRIMLALKRILARSERLPIMVFDEIDTGISGAIAAKVGRSLKELAQFHQVIAITHLPQIASQADLHFLVEKVLHKGRAVTRLRLLEESERPYEIARLLSADAVTEKALESARELLQAARC